MKITCPVCNSEITPNNINTLSNIVKCDYCNSTFPTSDLTVKKTINEIIDPPENAEFIAEIEADNTIAITYPTKGFTNYMIAISIFMLFWFGFVVFFTYMAFRAGTLFTLFTTPLWYIGLRLLIGLVNSVTETQIIRISKTEIKVVKERLINSRTIEIPIAKIEEIGQKKMNIGIFYLLMNFKYISKAQQSQNMLDTLIPSVVSETQSIYFCEDGTDFEQRWIVDTLKMLVNEMKK